MNNVSYVTVFRHNRLSLICVGSIAVIAGSFIIYKYHHHNTQPRLADDPARINDDFWSDDAIDDIKFKNTLPNLSLQRQLSSQPLLGAYCSNNQLIGIDKPDNLLKSYHICSKSDRPKSYDMPCKNYGGLVLYQYDNKTEWTLNGLQCKTGYILLRDSSNLPDSSIGQIHGGIYKSFFSQSCDSKLVASGFAYYENKWVFKSRAFNVDSNAHIMRESEIVWLKKALKQFCDYGTRTLHIQPPLNIYFVDKPPPESKK